MKSMNQSKRVVSLNPHEGQVFYMGRWVDKDHFRVFVYNDKGEQRLAESFTQYESLLASGLWFSAKPEKQEASKPIRKQKYDVAVSDS